MKTDFEANALDWGKSDGLVPAIVQDACSLRVLMLGYVNKESLQKTLETGLVTFYSRRKQRIWQKGETSGHVLRMRDIKLDCDRDTLLILADPEGPTCHLGTQSCFGDGEIPGVAVLADLAATIHDRRKNPRPGSYTAKLFAEGITRIAQKVGEEGVEVALAASTGGAPLAGEAADLLYHLLVLLEASSVDWLDVMKILKERANAKKSP
jgi:phosphoribosyl-ATP pyrophosphohydrolase/phosphoribosyl-AMP cyclohydrolase